MNGVGVANFKYFQEHLIEGKYFGASNLDKEVHVCAAFYKGKPVFGYLKHSIYAGGRLVLHRMDTSEYNSFVGSEAENGYWILFSALKDGEVCSGHLDNIKEYAQTNYGWSENPSKNKPMKKKNAPINWTVKFQSNDSSGEDVVLTKGSVTVDGIEYSPAAFKEDFDFRRAVLAKYEKEFGKVI